MAPPSYKVLIVSETVPLLVTDVRRDGKAVVLCVETTLTGVVVTKELTKLLEVVCVPVVTEPVEASKVLEVTDGVAEDEVAELKVCWLVVAVTEDSVEVVAALEVAEDSAEVVAVLSVTEDSVEVVATLEVAEVVEIVALLDALVVVLGKVLVEELT